jgi:hypothetical protein
MKYSLRFIASIAFIAPCLATVVLTEGCSSDEPEVGSNGGASGMGRAGAPIGNPTAGMGANGGSPSAGGKSGTAGDGAAGSPVIPQGGHSGGLGMAGSGSVGGGGKPGASGGSGGSGGKSGSGGGSGGSGGKAGGGSVSMGGAAGDACAVTTMPTGGTEHKTSNATGKAAGLDWALWSNGSGGSITTFDVPAFSADWANSGDFLARLGLQWNASKTYDQLGTVTAQYAYKKTGTGGGYSYIGMYGWSVSPCVEWYIVDDSYNNMPVNPGNTTNKGTADIDGGKYTLYTRNTTGTGGSKCSGTTSWVQFYSVRQKARQCGQISVTEHFAAWAAAGMALGKMDQAQILVEVGGGTGSVDFSVANVTVSQ